MKFRKIKIKVDPDLTVKDLEWLNYGVRYIPGVKEKIVEIDNLILQNNANLVLTESMVKEK